MAEEIQDAADLARALILPAFLERTAGHECDLYVASTLDIWAKCGQQAALIANRCDYTKEGRLEPGASVAIDMRLKQFAARLAPKVDFIKINRMFI